MKISLAMICKDETSELHRCLHSIYKYVDEIVVAFNGTNPETEKVLSKYKAKVIRYKWTGNFAEARQVSFDNCTHPFVLWMDADDTFEHPEKIPELLTQFEDRRLGALWLYYDYERDEYENTTMAVWRERILRKDWFNWEGVVHEECLKKIDCIQSKVQSDLCHIKHYPAKDRIERSGVRNLKISETQYKKEHEAKDVDAINVWNYAKSLNAMGQIEAALEVFKEFVQLTESDAHRYQAYNQLAQILRKLHRFDQALDCDLGAVKMKPQWPYAYFGLAKTYFTLENWKNVIFYTELGYRCKDPSDSAPIAFDPMSVTVRPLEPFVYALVQEGRFKEASVAISKALEFIPKSKYFLNWKATLEQALIRDKIEENSLVLYDYLQNETGNNGKLKSFCEALPEIVRDHPVFVRLANSYKSDDKGSNKIVVYCGSGNEYWDAESINQGIGGSEEAVIYLSKHLAKIGWEVEVYNNCLDEGNYDGVLWQGFWKYDQSQPCKIFISWRDTRPLMLAPEGSYACLWLHDVWKYEHFTQEELERVDKIFVLSKWHRTCLPEISDDKFYFTRNGIIPSHFDQKITRDPLSCVYASSPDRGLDILLNLWPKIIKEVPEAILHVYYGFTKNYDQVHKNDQRMKYFKEEILKQLKQPNVIYHGRVSHSELAKAFLGCGLWLYPTAFTEISCITAMKCQAAGTIPITTTRAALDETVRHGIKAGEDIHDSKIKDKWLQSVIYYLKHPEEQEYIRGDMIPWAKEYFDWAKVAAEWTEVFKNIKSKQSVSN